MKYVFDIKEYESPSERVQGFKKPSTVGLKMPDPIKVLGNNAFLQYKKDRHLTPEISKEISETFSEIHKKNPNRGAYIGRAFYVPGLEHPPGPRTAGIYDEKEYLEMIETFYKFVIDNDFDKEGSDIGLMLHPFINAYLPPLSTDPEIPFPGGAVTPSRDNPEDLCIIEVLWGSDEAIQTLPHDTYYVDFKKNIITEKNIQPKTSALKGKKGQEYEKTPIPPSHQQIQALNDLQILQIAADYKKIKDKFGPHRVEFILQPEGVIYRECLTFTFKEEQKLDINTKGTILSVEDAGDIARISKQTKIISISPKVIQQRNMDILTSTAVSAPHPLIILYPGTATTAHAATIFREQGHLLVYVRNDVFKDGEYVEIGLSGNHVVARRIQKPEIPNIIKLSEITTESQDLVGAKAFHLYELSQYSVKVPATFVISTGAFDSFLSNCSASELIANVSMDTTTEKLRTTIKFLKKELSKGDLDKKVIAQIYQAFDELGFKKVAVRSSANCEDSAVASFAGQFDTYLNVDRSKLVENIKKCWLSTFNDNVISYIIANKIPISDIKMAVVVQDMVDAKKAGVMFTKDASKNDNSVIVIEAVLGLGDKVVDSTAHPVKYVVEKSSKKETHQKSKPGNQVLSEADTKLLTETAIKIEKLYGKPQDIEWAIDDNSLTILQTRPITT